MASPTANLEVVSEFAPDVFESVCTFRQRMRSHPPSTVETHFCSLKRGAAGRSPGSPTLFPHHTPKLRSEFRVFYLDDGSLGGRMPEVLEDLRFVERLAADLELQLNRSKSELICEDDTTRGVMLCEVPGLQVLSR